MVIKKKYFYTFFNLLLILCLCFFCISNVKGDIMNCEEPGCYVSHGFPCSISTKCLFQYDEIIFNCIDVPIGSTIEATCTSMNNKEFSMSVVNDMQYQDFLDGDESYGTLNPSSQSKFFTTTQKTFTTLSTGLMQNHHLIIEVDDHSSSIDMHCDFDVYTFINLKK